MKKTSLMAIIAVTIFASCQKDETAPSSNLVYPEFIQEALEFVQVDLKKDEYGEPVLSFKTEDDMNTQVHNLKIMSETDSEQWYSEFDRYVSQNQFMWNVTNEISNAQSIGEIELIQSRHTGLLIYNNNEADQDASPYIPSTHFGNNLVCNKYGNVMINGEIHNFNNVTSYSELETPPLTKDDRLTGVYAHNESAKRRFWARLYKTSSGDIELFFKAQRRLIGKLYVNYRTYCYMRVNSASDWDFYYPMGFILKEEKGIFYKSPTKVNSGVAGNYFPFVRSAEAASFSITMYTNGVGASYARDLSYSQSSWNSHI